MNIDKAREIASITNRIFACESYLKSFKGRSYEDEFEVYYRGGLTCELEVDVLHIIIEHYEKELKELQEKLKQL